MKPTEYLEKIFTEEKALHEQWHKKVEKNKTLRYFIEKLQQRIPDLELRSTLQLDINPNGMDSRYCFASRSLHHQMTECLKVQQTGYEHDTYNGRSTYIKGDWICFYIVVDGIRIFSAPETLLTDDDCAVNSLSGVGYYIPLEKARYYNPRWETFRQKLLNEGFSSEILKRYFGLTPEEIAEKKRQEQDKKERQEFERLKKKFET